MLFRSAMATTSTAVRKSHRRRKPTAPAFVPSRPSDGYLALAQIPSTQLTTPRDGESLPRKLLVLDLNGTLVLRAPRAWGSQRPVMNRPFAKTFRDYVFHQSSQLDVMVWSSAQPHSVDSMVDVFFDSDRSRLVGLWARDTLGLTEQQYTQKVQTVKDLNIIWDAPAGLPPPIKIAPPPPMAILTDDPTTLPGYDPSQAPPPFKTRMNTSNELMDSLAKTEGSAEDQDRTTYWAVPEVRSEDPIPGLSGDGEGPAVVQESPRLYSALNTLLLDDSPLKAHLQPYNNLTLPEYTADLRVRDLKRRDALEEFAREKAEAGEPKDDKMDGSIDEKSSPDSRKERTNYFKTMRAAPFDKTLIAVIGVLHAVRHESSIVGWMRAGGMRPDAQEMARVAGLFEEGHNEQDEVDEGLDETFDDSGERSPLKRNSDDMNSSDHGSPKRRRSQPESVVATEEGNENLGATHAAEEMQLDVPTAVPPANQSTTLPDVEQQQLSSESTEPSSDPVLPMPAPATSPEAIQAARIPNGASSAQDTTSQPRRNKRRRVKTFYPATHPLSAEDSYPFFTGGSSDEKLWFQDREIYTYWVRRGLLALKECGIEPEAGVEGN